MKKILKVITILLIIFNLFILMISNINFNNIKALKVISGSMMTKININDIIIIIKSNYKVGDIVTIRQGNSSYTHRIKKLDKDKVITKGDSNNTLDTPIDRNKIIGKVIFIIPNLFYIVEKLVTIILIIISIVDEKNKEKK